MDLDSLFWVVGVIALFSVFAIVFWPFALGALILLVVFGGFGLTVIVFHSTMHRLHFCLLCGVFPEVLRRHLPIRSA